MKIKITAKIKTANRTFTNSKSWEDLVIEKGLLVSKGKDGVLLAIKSTVPATKAETYGFFDTHYDFGMLFETSEAYEEYTNESLVGFE